MPDTNNTLLPLKLTGSRIDKPSMPQLLRAGTARATRAVADPFLPDEYLRVVDAFDLSPGGRSAPTALREFELKVRSGQLMVLELPDGTTLITSGGRLEEELRRVAPEAVARGAVTLDDVQSRGAASRGLFESLGKLVSKVFVLERGGVVDAIIDEALDEVRKRAGDALADKLRDGAYWGINYVATRALMWAIEKRLLREQGLYRWVGAQKAATDLFSINDQRLAEEARDGTLLVFIHGTASNTTGSFGDLRSAASEAQLDWDEIDARYGGRIYAFEHRTFSESPIENALLLARTLPKGAHIDLVTHSRGGIVGDLLCVDWRDADKASELIASYRRFRTEHNRDATDLDEADAKDRNDLLSLKAELLEKNLTIGRYVRVAAPVNGTLLAGSNLDLFLSGVLTLVGTVTTLQASPYYMALKRIVLEVARNRADANRVPGLEAMLPGSAVSRFLRLATPQKDLRLGVIAGDIEGASRFKRLVEFLADWVIYERNDNDLVVDTASMATGLAHPQNAKRLFVQGPKVDHFSYFGNADSRAALAGWLTAADPGSVPGFDTLAGGFEEPRLAPAPRARARGAQGPRPVVIVLPGIMGSHLQLGNDRIWFDPADIAAGGLKKIEYTADNLTRVSAEKLFDMSYGDLCEYLDGTHNVVRYAYDWRRPVEHAATGLAYELRAALTATRETNLPVRILAHSMGGLVARAMAATEPDLWNEFLAREGSRFVMLGTPNQGSHLMVEMLLGKGDTVRKLAMLDACHDLQEVLDIIAGFRGALQLLPRKGFKDAGGTPVEDYLQRKTWEDLKPGVSDFWFGDNKVGIPDESACSEARTLWEKADFKTPCVPGNHSEKVIYVCGKADNTPCGIHIAGGRVKMVGTPEGDGSVSWASGHIDGIGEAYLMDAAHGDLANTKEHFESLLQLLAYGETQGLQRGWQSAAVRGVAGPATIFYDAGPAAVPTDEEIARSLMGASIRRKARPSAPPAVLHVNCAAMDLCYARDPILVGHYEKDPLAGAEAIIDRKIVSNELTMRNHLGLYPGPVGTATVVLAESNGEERLRGTQRGAVVAGLGEWGKLTTASLTEAVRVGALRYMLAEVERRGAVCADAGKDCPSVEVGLASLLLGYNSTTNISITDSVHAIIRGILEANRQFAVAQRRGGLRVRIVRLELIECYQDVAISAARALQRVAEEFTAEAAQFGMRVEAAPELNEKEGGVRPRLEVASSMGYWPRLIVTDATEKKQDGQAETGAMPAAGTTRAALVAGKLRYVYLSQRARAESDVVQRQPGLIETLVKLSINQPNYNIDLSRTLFQLMVPLDFKEAARQAGALALLVDETTANFPWELLCADDKPLVTRTAIVRQFVSTEWRRRVRSTIDKTAYVIGNPSTEGFAKAFPSKTNANSSDPLPLPGAESEAYAVVKVLQEAGFKPDDAIGQDRRGVDVINLLFKKPYRIIHVAAHGEFNIEAADGSRRSGVLLSDGLMLTAAEIHQMEIVPDLVFLNCCHLGQVDDKPVVRDVEFNRLASSIARELIEIGVRAVIVAGWAVDDRAGQAFAEAFYRYLMLEGQTFGMAVHHARCDTYGNFMTTNTWGAFQAYGDPGFLIDPSLQGGYGADTGTKFVSASQLLDALEQIREKMRQPGCNGQKQTVRELQRDINALMGRCPKESDWPSRGDVLFKIGMVYADCGEAGFERACEYLMKAIEQEEKAGRVPIKAIEDLGNMEVRHGADMGDLEIVKRGSDRIMHITHAVASQPGDASLLPTAERCGLLGSALKRLALMHASAGEDLKKELTEARDWYEKGEEKSGTSAYSAYCANNRLMLDALLGNTVNKHLLHEMSDAARKRFQLTRDYWDAVHPADLQLVAGIADGLLDKAEAAAAEIDKIVTAYEEVRSSVPEDGKSFDSVIKQLNLLATLADRLLRKELAVSLQKVAERLLPDSRGGAAQAAAAAAPQARKAKARKRK